MEEVVLSKQVVDSSIDIDRPDIVKKQWSDTLTFKEIKDALFKFLMQSNIKFSSFEKLTFPITIKSKIDGSTFTLNNNTYYTATCKLLDITVDGKPVYIIAVPRNELSLDKRQFGKLLYLKQVYKLIIFNQEDCKQLGIDISNKSWLQSLNKVVLKKWAKLLFKKISDLGKSVESKYSLNDIYRYINGNSSNKPGLNLAKITTLKQEGLELKHKLLKSRLEFRLPQFTGFSDNCLNYLSKIDKESSKYIEDLFDKVKVTFFKLDIKQRFYKDFFIQKSGSIEVVNKERLVNLLEKELPNYFNVDFINLGYGALKIQDKKTFQSIYIVIEPTKSKKTRGISFNKKLLKNLKDLETPIFHYLLLNFNKETSRLESIKGYIFSVDDLLKNNIPNRLYLYNSSITKTYTTYLLD